MIDRLVDKAWWVDGLTTCRGVAVVRPTFVAFIPTERPKNLGVEFAWGAAGFVPVGERKLAPEPIIAELSQTPAPDERTLHLVTGLHGLVWYDARVDTKKVPLRRKFRYWFLRDKQSIRFARVFTSEEIETFSRAFR